MRKTKAVGFADVYLQHCDEKSNSNEIFDIEVYKKLVELDTKLGTTASEQLYKCLQHTTRLDIMKVGIHYLSEC